MASKKLLLKVVLAVVLFLLIPFLIGRVTVLVLDNTLPQAPPPTSRSIRAEGESAIQSLQRARAITRIALVLIGIYYVILVITLIILKRRKMKSLSA
jgi:hypothetical protein